MVDLSIVIVTWNCRNFAEECLKSLRIHLPIPAEIIVVDNGSTDGTVNIICQQYPEVRVISSKENMGFARANNFGIRFSSGRYIALINPDVTLHDGSISRLLNFLETRPNVGIVGPRMFGPDGAVLRSGMRFPSLWNCLCDALVLHRVFGRNRLFGGQMMAEFCWNETRSLDVLNGWFWIIRRCAIEQVGLLDEQFFMYGEDIDWCKRFHNAGWGVVFKADAAAIHYGGGSSGRQPIRFYLEMQRANLQYWRKHRRQASLLLYLILLGIHHMARLAGYGILYLLNPATNSDMVFKIRRSVAFMRWLVTREVSEL